jgi:hypothetical protein
MTTTFTQEPDRAAQAIALSAAIRDMYESRKRLHEAFPKRRFTPDGRMVGDIGEAIAEIYYRVTVDASGRKHWDGKREDACSRCPEVQVRVTQSEDTYVKESPDDGCLLVFKIFPDGTWECCYNGSTDRVWDSLALKNAHGSGEKPIKLDALRNLNKVVGEGERVELRIASVT